MSAIAASTARPARLRLLVASGLLYLLILSFPFFSVKPKIFRPDWWIGGALIVLFAFSVLARGRLRLDPIGYAVLGFNAAVLLSTAVNFWSWEAAQWSEFLTLWLQLVFATLLYLALANLKLSVPRLRFLLRLWIGVAVMVALYGLYQALARNLDLPLAYLPYLHSVPTEKQLQAGLGYGGYVRPSSFLREPTYLGMYLLAPLLITATLVFYRWDRIWLFRSQRTNAVLLAILVGAFLASFALAAYVTLTALLFLALFNRWSRVVAVRLVLPLFVVFIAFVVASQVLEISFLQGLETRLSLIGNALLSGEIRTAGPSVPTRFREVLLALATWFHKPIFGVGLNQLQFTGTIYAPEFLPLHLVERGYTHNMWLEVLVQCGAVGFVFFGLIWFQALRMMWAVFRQGGEPLRWLGFAFFFVLLATMIRGLMGGPFIFTLYWFYLGMASIVYRIARSEQHARLG